MALLANRVAGAVREPGRIDDVIALRPGRVRAVFTVTALAADGLDRAKARYAVQRAGLGARSAGVAEQALRSDRTAEVGLGVALIARRHVPGAACGVVADRRLVEIAVLREAEASSYPSRANEEIEPLAMAAPQQFQ